MDRRESERKRADARVILHHPLLPGRPCRTRDLSPGGAFVLTPDAAHLRRGERLELTFTVALGNVTRVHHLSGVVAQITDEGVGLVMRRAERSTGGPLRAAG